MMSKQDTKPVALVTGGSSGIGRAIARELAQCGFSLLLVSNQSETLHACKTDIEKNYGVSCYVFCMDLSCPDAAITLYDYTKQLGLEVDVLVNNAGMLIFSEAAEASIEQTNRLLQLHVVTPTLLCQLFGKDMKKRKKGYILNVSSISAIMPYPGISVYASSKSYLRFFTRALRSEMKLYQIKVTCLVPGATATALYNPEKVNIRLALQLGIMHPAEFVAHKAIKALWKGQAECIPGIFNKLLMRLLPIVPDFFIYLLHKHTNLLNKGQNTLG